jgi:hypothetical protein
MIMQKKTLADQLRESILRDSQKKSGGRPSDHIERGGTSSVGKPIVPGAKPLSKSVKPRKAK